MALSKITTESLLDGEITLAKLASLGSDGQVMTSTGGSSPPAFEAAAAGGIIVQVVNVQSGAVATTTTTIVTDDTIPQNNEGGEFMTLAITPTNSSNKLRIDVIINTAFTASSNAGFALFQDSTANALASGFYECVQNGHNDTYTLTHYMAAGTTSATTFKVRAGAYNSGTTTFNGGGGSRVFGGTIASSITITEIAV